MTSRSGQQRITIHILVNISRNKSNQSMELGQLIEHNVNKLVPYPFIKKSKLSIYLDQQSEIL